MINSNKLTKRVNLIIAEGQKRGFDFEVLDYKKELIKASKNGKGFIFETFPEILTIKKAKKYKGWDRKDVEKDLMAELDMELPETFGVVKNKNELANIKVVFPAVVKPVLGTLSKNVFVNINSQTDLEVAVDLVEKTGHDILIEKFVPGLHYRILIANFKYVGCVERRSSNVTGDGKLTIKKLVGQRNQEPERKKRTELNTTVHKLVFDETSKKILAKQSLTEDSILPKGQMLKIQTKISAGVGSDYVDYTDIVHPSIYENCIRFTKKHGLLIMGFDIITPDLSKPLAKSGGVFNEFNLKPFIDLNENNNIGKTHPASKIIWDGIEKRANKWITTDFAEI